VNEEFNPTFPPLFTGQQVTGQADPFAKACSQALLGCDAGLVIHNINADALRAAIVFTPEVALEQAMAVMITCGVGFQNALGALAPPEVAVHLGWQGEILVNGAGCGRLRVAASHADPRTEPNWLVVGLEIPLIPPSENSLGYTPDKTCLYEEGCVDVNPQTLLEAWVRHSLVWINRWADDGVKPLHAEWRGLAQDQGEDISFDLAGERYKGTYVGVDEDFGMLLRSGDDTRVIPLSRCLEKGGHP